jgi:hypothetical protein
MSRLQDNIKMNLKVGDDGVDLTHLNQDSIMFQDFVNSVLNLRF